MVGGINSKRVGEGIFGQGKDERGEDERKI